MATCTYINDKPVELLEQPLKVITMNVSGGKGNGDDSNVNKRVPLHRRQHIVDVIWENKPDILLVQEFPWKRIRGGKTWEDAPIPDPYEYTGNKEASIIYDSERFDLKELAQTKLQRPLEELKRNEKVSQDFSPLTRSTIILLEQNGSTSLETFKILVVSWHGVHRAWDEEKQIQFQDLQVYLKELSEREEAAVLLGGDFNINIDLIRGFVSEDFSLSEYEPSERRKGKVIDYFIVSPELFFENVKYIKLKNVQNRELDHDPVWATVVKKESVDGSG